MSGLRTTLKLTSPRCGRTTGLPSTITLSEGKLLVSPGIRDGRKDSVLPCSKSMQRTCFKSSTELL